MTPLPKPTPRQPATRRTRGYPMTAAQRLRWRTPAPRTPLVAITDAEVDAAMTKIAGRPYLGDTVEALAGAPEDEVDAGYLAAIRLAPRQVGNEPGQVPPRVADRLYDAGLIRRAETKKSEQE